MDIVKNDLGENINSIIVTLHSEDYKSKFESEINKSAQKATVKGFRKGKTPPSFIKKMYGESYLAEIIDKMLYEKLVDYLTKENIKTLAQPILSKETHIHLDVNNLDKNYSATFEVGVIPPYEIKGLEEEYEYFTNEVSDDEVETQLKMYAKNLGKLEDVEDITDEDTIYASASQLDNGNLKEDGFKKDIVISLSRLKSDDLKKQLLSSKKGSNLTAKIADLENGDVNFVKKYVLGLGDEVEVKEEDEVQMEITGIKRMIPAELTDELVNERFNVHTFSEFRDILKSNLGKNKEAAAKALLQVKIKNKIMSDTSMELSEKFTRKWLTEVEKLEEEKIEKEISNFIQDLKWNYIKEDLAKQYNITVEQNDMRSKIDATIYNYEMRNGQLSDKDYKKVVEQISTDREQMYKMAEDIKTEKVLNVLVESVKKNEIPLNAEEFKLKIDELNKK